MSKKFEIYKFTCVGDSSTGVKFSTSKKEFEREIQDNIDSGFDVSMDKIKLIKADSTEELCEKLEYSFDIGNYS
jgi:hypothetical protein